DPRRSRRQPDRDRRAKGPRRRPRQRRGRDRAAEREREIIAAASRQTETGTITRKSTQPGRRPCSHRGLRPLRPRVRAPESRAHPSKTRGRAQRKGSPPPDPPRLDRRAAGGRRLERGRADCPRPRWLLHGGLLRRPPLGPRPRRPGQLSLDHIRRGAVAERLTEVAAERQVIVFTHDLEFVVSLSAAAGGRGVPFTERSIQRRGDRTPGVCVDAHPWKAKDVGPRLDELERLLAEIRRERSNWDADRYEAECA